MHDKGAVERRAVHAEVGGRFGEASRRGVRLAVSPLEIQQDSVGDFIAAENRDLAPSREPLTDGGGVDVSRPPQNHHL